MNSGEDDDRRTLILAGLVTVALIYVYPLFLSTPLLEPDEGLHATISQEMVERGDWIVPTFRGAPFLDKPILYFWAQMASLKAFGMNESAVRLPGLMFGLLGGATTWLLATRLFGNSVGPIAALMTLTMLIPLSLAQAAAHDVALVPWINLALLCLWEMEQPPGVWQRSVWLGGASLMFALAILTKALIGVALIVVGYGLFLVLSRRIRPGNCLRLVLAILVGAMLASPWFVAMEFRVNGYLYYYFIERHVMGFVTATQRHGHEPWHYYFPFLTLGALPWIGYLVPLLRDLWKSDERRSSAAAALILILCWLAGGVLFLSVARSKLVTYALPLFPAIAILCAITWRRFVADQLSTPARTWFVSITRFSGVLGIITPPIGLLCCQQLLSTQWPAECWLIAACVSAASVISWRAFEQGRYATSFAACCACTSGLVALIMTWPVPLFAEDHSERSLAEWVNRQKDHPPQLILVGEKPSSLIFYLNEETRRNLAPNQFIHQEFIRVQSRRHLRDGEALAVTRKALRRAEAEDWSMPGVLRETAGQFELFLKSWSATSVRRVGIISERPSGAFPSGSSPRLRVSRAGQ